MLLAIDCSTSAASVALTRDGHLAAEISWDVGRRHSQELLDRLGDLLAIARAVPQDLTRIAVASGPGSFNGVRVAMTAAKTLAFSLGLPIAAFPTLDVAAASIAAPCGTICAVLEAGRGEVYTAQFQRSREQPQPTTERVVESLWRVAPPSIATPEMLAGAMLPLAGPVLFCGEWRRETRDTLARLLGTRAWFASPLNPRRAAALAAIAGGAPASDWTREPATIEPLYLRRPAITMSKKQPGYRGVRGEMHVTTTQAGDPEGEGDARALRD
jgi:tRNA threonylcarbamoyladenosine biosynthesis protein TsaB